LAGGNDGWSLMGSVAAVRVFTRPNLAWAKAIGHALKHRLKPALNGAPD